MLRISNGQWDLKHSTLTLAPPKMKYLDINLMKYVQDLYEGKLQKSDE